MITKQLYQAIRAQLLNRFLVGADDLVTHFFIAFLSRGHVLIEGPPGTGKTLAAHLLARTLSRKFQRIQFTSDMLPADILGASIFSPASQQFVFISGPIFADFVLADEINRTPPRTQSALLEAMEERQVTIEGRTHLLSPEFFVVATQNPFEHEGTFPLPQAQMDRFLFKLEVSHGTAAHDSEVVARMLRGELPPPFSQLQPLDYDHAAIAREIADVVVSDAVIRYAAEVVERTRNHRALTWGSSVRGTLSLIRTGRVRALLEGRTFMLPEDVKALALPVLRHRVHLSPDAELSGQTPDTILKEILGSVPLPA